MCSRTGGLFGVWRIFGMWFRTGRFGTGGGYYHWASDAERVFWDRLPMTVAFMGMFAAVLGEFADARGGRWVLGPLVGMGVLSVMVWRWSGDLRWYGLVNFYPVVMIPVMLVWRRGGYTEGGL